MGSLTPKRAEDAPDLRRSRVPFGIRGAEWGVEYAPGAVVDLNKRLPSGLRVRDVVDLSWFEPVTPAVPPMER